MMTCGMVEVYLHAFLTSALDGGEWSASRPGCFTGGERAPGTHWIEGLVGPRAGLDTVAKTKNSYPYRESKRGRLDRCETGPWYICNWWKYSGLSVKLSTASVKDGRL
jgi:hypothetical protein